MTALPLLQAGQLCAARGPRRVLREVSIELHAGERLAVVGPTGAGKTTLLHTLLGFVPLAAGSIRWFGQACVRETDFAAVRGDAGLLFQEPDDQLFCPSVIEDVAFGPLNRGLSDSQALAVATDRLAELDLLHLSRRPVQALSGGEKRLVALAGVLALQPRVLLLDEPSSGLDAHARDHLIGRLRALPQAMLLVSHDQELVRQLAQRVQPLQPPGLRESPDRHG